MLLIPERLAAELEAILPILRAFSSESSKVIVGYLFYALNYFVDKKSDLRL